MPLPDLKRAPVGERLHDPLLVLEVEQKTFGDKDCTVLTLGNSTGRLTTAPFWGADQLTVAGIARSDVVQVIAEVGQFRGRRQLNVSSIRPQPRGSVDRRMLLPSVGDVTGYWKTLDGWRAELRRPRVKAILALFYDDDEFRRAYEECPASLAGHHAELGGLLKHTCEVATIARQMSRVCHANWDLVLAGALLHDIGKLDSYRWDGAFEYTDCGSLLGHVVLGAVRLDRRVAAADPRPCTDQELMLLQHMIVSHHGKLEFGAPVPPMTLEAEVLHYADNASAKTASMSDALADSDNFAGEEAVSARTLWQLDRRRAYRGSSDWGLGGAG
ncbi:MAG: HD domain-containing protein [Gemmatimonadales bacterium]|nr:HD domain-containing protein [Gemmatimonadales bacterium]